MPSRPVMVRSFDALAQAKLWAGLRGPVPDGWVWRRPQDPLEALRSAEGMTAEFTGQLRTAHLFADRIALTDSQLLDGVFFQALGPERINALIGRTDIEPPLLEVVCRARTLAESLRSFVGGGHEDRLRYVELSTVTATGRAVDFSRLPLFPDATVQDAAVDELAGVCATAVEQGLGLEADAMWGLGRAWQCWLDAADAGLIVVRQHRPVTAQHFEQVARSWGPPLARDDHAELVETLCGTMIRSVALSLIREADLDDEQRHRVTDWYDQLYQDALASNLDADWLDLRHDAPATKKPETSGDQGRLALSGAVVSTLGEMSVSDFASLTSRHRQTLSDWRRERSADTTARVAFAIDQQTRSEDLERARRRTLAGMSASVAVALMAFMFDALSLARSSWAVAVLVTALVFTVAAGAAPYVMRRRELRSFRIGTSSIYLTGQSRHG